MLQPTNFDEAIAERNAAEERATRRLAKRVEREGAGKKQRSAAAKAGSKRRTEREEDHAEQEWEWKVQVRARDGNKCQFPQCTFHSPSIPCHHVAPRSQRKDLIYVVDNGKCLCLRHHEFTHNNPLQGIELGLLSNRSRELAEKEGTLGRY